MKAVSADAANTYSGQPQCSAQSYRAGFIPPFGPSSLLKFCEYFFRVSQGPFTTWNKHILDPVLVRRQFPAIPHLGSEQRSKPRPLRVRAAFQVLTRLCNRFFKTADAIDNSLSFWVHELSTKRIRQLSIREGQGDSCKKM